MDCRQVVGEPARQVDVGDRAVLGTDARRDLRQRAPEPIQAGASWIAVSLSNVKRTNARLPLRRQERPRRRAPASVLVLVKEQLRRLPALCVACRCEGAALPGHRNRLTPPPCRSDPDRSPVCPHPGPAVPGRALRSASSGRSGPSTASGALRRTRGCAGVRRARIPRCSPILARVFRRPAPRRRTGAASCLQLLRGR